MRSASEIFSQGAEPIRWDVPEPICGWVPVLMQSQLPDSPANEIVLAMPTPDDLVPPPPNQKNLVNRINKEDAENVKLAEVLDKIMETADEPPKKVARVDKQPKKVRIFDRNGKHVPMTRDGVPLVSCC